MTASNPASRPHPCEPCQDTADRHSSHNERHVGELRAAPVSAPPASSSQRHHEREHGIQPARHLPLRPHGRPPKSLCTAMCQPRQPRCTAPGASAPRVPSACLCRRRRRRCRRRHPRLLASAAPGSTATAPSPAARRFASSRTAAWCKCQACPVCVSPPSPPPSPRPPPPPPSPPELECHSGIHGDSSVTQCAPWCSLDAESKHGKRPLMEQHCEHCKCKACRQCVTPPHFHFTLDQRGPYKGLCCFYPRGHRLRRGNSRPAAAELRRAVRA